MGTDRLYLLVNSVQYGPFTADEVKRFAAEGRFDSGDSIRKEGESAWVPAGRIPNIKAIFEHPASSVPASGDEKCGVCGAPMENGASFCIECGHKPATTNRQTPASACPKCGERLEGDDVFCPECGTRVIPATPPESREAPKPTQAVATPRAAETEIGGEKGFVATHKFLIGAGTAAVLIIAAVFLVGAFFVTDYLGVNPLTSPDEEETPLPAAPPAARGPGVYFSVIFVSGGGRNGNSTTRHLDDDAWSVKNALEGEPPGEAEMELNVTRDGAVTMAKVTRSSYPEAINAKLAKAARSWTLGSAAGTSRIRLKITAR